MNNDRNRNANLIGQNNVISDVPLDPFAKSIVDKTLDAIQKGEGERLLFDAYRPRFDEIVADVKRLIREMSQK